MRRVLTVLFLMMSVSQMSFAQIDIHSNAITDGYMAAVKAHGMELDEGFPILAWSVEAHLAFMDEAGIQTAVLTMPAPQPKGSDAAAATDDVIESLLTITSPDHILYGSDYPYVAPQALIGAKKSLETRLASHGLNPEDVLYNNAARLFGKNTD